MDLKISIDFGGSMRGDLATWLVNFGMVCMPSIVLPIKDNGRYVLTTSLLNASNGYLSYSNFRVGPVAEQYPLTISGFEGYTVDPFFLNTFHFRDSINGMAFTTTRDRDNDKWFTNCAADGWEGKAGGWWYRQCSTIPLNQKYDSNSTIFLNNHWYNLPFVEIKIRPRNCNI